MKAKFILPSNFIQKSNCECKLIMVSAEWDVENLHAETRKKLVKSAGAAIGFMPDDSKGEKEIFRIEDFEMVPMNESNYGMFFGGDSYVIKYSYEKDGSPAYIVYFWQGSQSSQVLFDRSTNYIDKTI